MKIGNCEVYGVIYKITNNANGKSYIGQTTRGFDARYGKGNEPIERVYNYHKNKKINGYGYNSYLFYSIEKYGFDSFSVSKIYDFAYSKTELDIKEELYICLFNCINGGYNFKHGGSNGKYSYESRLKISNSAKVRLSIKENHPMFGKHFSEESRKKMSKAQIGKPSNRKGCKHTESAKLKMSVSRTGKKLTDEHKRNIGMKSKGRNNPAARPVYVYDNDAVLIKCFGTVNECAEWLLENKILYSNAKDVMASMRSVISKGIRNKRSFGEYKISYTRLQV